MKVSVVMPVYNAEEYIEQGIESILNQSFKDYEFIIVDDGSKDKTTKIINEFVSKDKRIKLIKNAKGKGVTGALNTGIDIAKGEYIVRMDADDISLPNRIEIQVKFMDENHDIGIAGSWYQMFGDAEGIKELPTIHEKIKVEMILHGALAHPTVIFRNKLFKDNSLKYDPNYVYGQDYDLWVRASKVLKITNIPQVLLKYRIHKKNVGTQYSLEQTNNVRKVRRSQLLDLGIYPTYEEMEIHESMANWNYSNNKKFIRKSLEWISKIIAFNQVKKNYDQEILVDFLYKEWLQVYKGVDTNDVGFVEKINNLKSDFDNLGWKNLSMNLVEKYHYEEVFFNPENPKISVVMPVYNSEKYIAETIESILNQTYKNFEFLIINDNSTDSTEEIVKKYSLKDERIVFMNNKQQKGIVGALNTGINEAKGEYLARMDSDDISVFERFHKQVQFMDQNVDIGLCGTWYNMFGKYEGPRRLPTDHEQIKVVMLFYGPLAHPTVMIRKSVLIDNDLKYRQEYIWIEDIDLWVRMSKVTKIANLPEILLQYRTHESSVGSTKSEDQALKVKTLHLVELKDLGIIPSLEEIQLHENIGYGNFSFDIVFFWDAKSWFNKIIENNSVSKIYDQGVLIRFLTNKLIDIYKLSGYRSFRRILVILKFFLLKKNLSIRERLRLLSRLIYIALKLQRNAITKKN